MTHSSKGKKVSGNMWLKQGVAAMRQVTHKQTNKQTKCACVSPSSWLDLEPDIDGHGQDGVSSLQSDRVFNRTLRKKSGSCVTEGVDATDYCD